MTDHTDDDIEDISIDTWVNRTGPVLLDRMAAWLSYRPVHSTPPSG